MSNQDDSNHKNNEDKVDVVSGPYIPVMIELVIKYHHVVEFPFYVVKSGGSMVKISCDMKELPKTLENYRAHGLEEIYFDEDDYKIFLQNIRGTIDQSQKKGDSLQDLGQIYLAVRQQLIKVGLNSFVLMLAEEVNRATMTRLSQVENLREMVETYRQKCPEEFFKYLTMSFIGQIVIDSFPWASPQIKQKVGMAAMLCDVSLDQSDYADWKKWDELHQTGKLPLKILNHPLASAKMVLAADPTMPSEVIQMIEMHHENCEGTGFPGRIGHTNIPLLAAIFIILRDFTDHMTDELKRSGKFEAEELLEKFYKKYTKGMFRQASMGLFKAFSFKI